MRDEDFECHTAGKRDVNTISRTIVGSKERDSVNVETKIKSNLDVLCGYN